MGSLGHTELTSDQVMNPRVSAGFVFLLVVLVYMFFALQAAEAKTVTVQLNVNGLLTTQTTAHQVVGELVDSLYPDPTQVIATLPDRSAPITPNLNVSIQVKPAPLNRLSVDNLAASRAPELKPLVVAAAPKPAVKVDPKSPAYSGTATWYRHGGGLTAASTQFPKGTHLRVTADASGRYVDVEINDYGPTAETGVNLDLNQPAFQQLAPLGAGRINIHYYVI